MVGLNDMTLFPNDQLWAIVLTAESLKENLTMNKISKLSREKLMGIATIVLGVITLASPLLAGDYVLILVGILVVVAGAVRMLWAFNSDGGDKGVWTFFLGVLTLLAGLAVLANPVMAGELLAIFLTIYLAADGFIEFIWGLTLQDKPGRAWLMFGGVASILLAFLLFSQMPIPAALVIGIIMGTKLLFIGITMLKFDATFKSAVKSLGN